MNRKAGNTKVTESLFWNVKEAIKRGKTQEEIRKFLGVGLSTITNINKSDSYKEYLVIRKKKQIDRSNDGEKKSSKNEHDKEDAVSFVQIKGIAKDIDEIKVMLGRLCDIGCALLDIWKEG